MSKYKEFSCQQCGATFFGGTNAKFCEPCKEQRHREAARIYQAKKRVEELAAMQAAIAEKREIPAIGVSENFEPWDPIRPNTDQCKTCGYKGHTAGVISCNYLFYAGHCRLHEGNKCLSYSANVEKPEPDPWGAGITGGNTLAGYKY